MGGGESSTASGPNSTIGGGQSNIASGNHGTVSGGAANQATDLFSTVSGGFSNKASVTNAFVGGGYNNTANGNSSTVSGGKSNIASGPGSTVGGGGYDGGSTFGNTAEGGASTISGGVDNHATSYGSTVGGGGANKATLTYSTVSGGYGNQASGEGAFVGGGGWNGTNYAGNTASGSASTVPGGISNVAGGAYSFAAGRSARALHDGAFVWADNTGAGKPISSTTPNQFIVRATGGINLVTAVDGSGDPTAGNVALSGGSFSFGAATRQMLNLWNQEYGIGVQSAALYLRSSGNFNWFRLGVHSDATDDPGSGGTRLMRLDGGGNLHVLGTVSGGGADLAERIVTSDMPQPGDVVEIDPDHEGQFRLAASANSSAVAGVVSTHPGVQLNQPDDGTGDGGVQLALAGRVPVKVSAENGAIRQGDLLVASATPGHAMRAPANAATGTIIGKALGRLDEGTGLIEMLVMLR